jgi:hypothetical protein
VAFAVVAALAVSGVAEAADAAPGTTPDTGIRAGQIVVALPADTDHDVSVTFGDGKVSLALPAGARFPLDFERESNGLLRSGEVVAIDATHVRLDLKMASGVVDGIDVSSKSVVVKLRRRFAETRDASAGREDDYRLGADDRIQVSVNGDPKLTQQLTIGPDGRVSFPLLGDVTVDESLDKVYGLDDQAVKAATQWTFRPGTKDGMAVAVRVHIEMRFTLK